MLMDAAMARLPGEVLRWRGVRSPYDIILCGTQMYVTLGQPEARWYGYDTGGCSMGMQLDIGSRLAPDGTAMMGFWPTRFQLIAGGDLVLWWP